MPDNPLAAANALSQVLVVDDDDAIRDLIVAILEDEGFVVSAARDGVDALASVHLCPPDVITLDLTMPVMGGAAFLRTIHRERYRGKVLIVSAEKLGYSPGEIHADDYLPKPFDLSDLVRRVEALAHTTEYIAG